MFLSVNNVYPKFVCIRNLNSLPHQLSSVIAVFGLLPRSKQNVAANVAILNFLGSPRLNIDQHGSPWANMGHHGPTLANMGHHGSMLTNMTSYGPVFANMGHHGLILANMDHHGPILANMDHHGPIFTFEIQFLVHLIPSVSQCLPIF